MTNLTHGQRVPPLGPGLYLSVPRPEGDALVFSVEDEDDALTVGMASFFQLGYGERDTIYATLFRIADNGGLASSQCFPISGPEVE